MILHFAMSTLAWGRGALGTAFARSLHMAQGSFSFSNFATLWGLRETKLKFDRNFAVGAGFLNFVRCLKRAHRKN